MTSNVPRKIPRETPKTGDFLLVRVPAARNKHKHYVATVVDEDDNLGEWEVKYCRRVQGKIDEFVLRENDVSWVSDGQILRVLTCPTVGLRDKVLFNVDLSLAE